MQRAKDQHDNLACFPCARSRPSGHQWSAPPRHGRCSPQRLATGMVSPVPDARPSCALNRIFECSLAQRRSRLREQSCSSRYEGVETVLLKFNRLFAETNVRTHKLRHFRHFASQELIMFGWKFESSQPHQSHFVPLIFHWFSPELPNRSLVVWHFCSPCGLFDLDC